MVAKGLTGLLPMDSHVTPLPLERSLAGTTHSDPTTELWINFSKLASQKMELGLVIVAAFLLGITATSILNAIFKYCQTTHSRVLLTEQVPEEHVFLNSEAPIF